MRISNYDSKPSAIESIGDGSYFYRWDITQVERVDDMDSDTVRISWDCREVIVGNPTENIVTEAVINALWGGGVEQKLINDYYAFIEGIESDEEGFKQPYIDYLTERKAIKAQIKADFALWR